MPHWKQLLTIAVVVLVVMAIANRVAFLKRLTGAAAPTPTK